MPIYDYVCESCGHVVEVIHGISASGPAACERCGGPMKRALSAPAILFKGSGWAKKDARDASRAKATSTAKASETSSTEGARSGSDSASSTSEKTGGDTPAASSTSEGAGSSTAPTTTTGGATGGSGAAAG